MSFQIQGHNIFHVRETFKWAKQWCQLNGPLACEIKTYRYHGHSMSDPGITYRSKDEIDNIRKTQDPIGFIKNVILDNKVATEDELKVAKRREN